ncbi:TonB-dependent receptor [Sphingosinicella sp.]|uniref:TonB-dependent receptor domain-containing protein n=1 Tax=Sphingosinicella sp. TaxID=1917971 RepID=UPI00180EF962|nr:TonB-dependent receptor [Sphingosinicella sp.]MBA4758208.1 hypothetical protein [Sphingosinicella sp.]
MKTAALALAAALGAMPGRAWSASDLVFEPAYFEQAAPVTAYDMVVRLPGFVIASGDAVRGYAGAAGNVLVDGVRPSTKSRTLDDILKAIPAGQVARIELIRTARPGIDQKGAQLLANVVRISDTSNVRAFTLSNYTYTDGTTRPAFRAETSRRGITGGWEASLLLSRNQDESGNGERVKRSASGDVLERARISVDSPIRGAEARMAADLPLAGGTARGNLSLTHQDYRTRETLAFLEANIFGPSARTDDRVRTNSGELGGEWSRPFGDVNTKLLALATRKDIAVRSTSDDGGALSDYMSDSVADERILRATVDRTPARGPSWEISGEVAYNALDSVSALSVAGTPITLPGADVTITEWRADLSALMKLAVSSRLTAEMTLRGEGSRLGQKDHSTGFDYSREFGFLKPKLLLRWSPGARGLVRLRVERDVGQLDFSDFASSASLIEGTVDAGNLDLRPQTAWVFEADVERRFGTDGALTLAYRHERIDNVLDLLPVDGLDAPGNIGEGTVNAAVLRFTWPLDTVGLSGGRVSFSGEWRRSSVRDPVTGDRRPITALAPFESEIHASLDRPRLRSTFALDVYFGQKLTYRRINEVRRTFADPYATVKWTFAATPQLTIETSVQNALSRKHDRDRIVYTGPRSADDVQFTENRWYRAKTGAFISLRYQH